MSACVGSHRNVEPDEIPDAEYGYLCLNCWNGLRRALTQLPAVATWLEVNIATGGQVSNSEPVTGSPTEDPIPLRLDTLDLIGPAAPNPTLALIADMYSGNVNSRGEPVIDQRGDPAILDELSSWALLVEEETGKAWDHKPTLSEVVTYLAGSLSWIVDQPWVDEFAAQVHDLGNRAHRIVPWRPEKRLDKDPCVLCGVRAVVWHIAESLTRCEKRAGGCGRTAHMSDQLVAAMLPETRRAG